MTCPGSVEAEAQYPDTSSPHAAEGTVLHEVAALCLELDLEPYAFVGETWDADGYQITITRDMADHIVPVLDYIREQGAKIFVEHRVDLAGPEDDPWLPGVAGILDVGLVYPEKIVLWDWKFGRGVAVTPENNRQMKLYALGFWWEVARHLTDATDFELHIEQPRISGAGGRWRCTLEDLLEFAREAREAAAETRRPNAPRRASLEACLFCRAQDDCREYQQFNLDIVSKKFDDLDAEGPPEFPDPEGLTPERRSYIARHAAMFEAFLRGVKSTTLAHALAGEATPGLKAVLGNRGPRAWGDPARAERELTRLLGPEDAYEKKVLSPTQAEKVLGTRQWKKMERLIVRSAAQPVLVPETDRREAIEPVTNKFDALSDVEVDITDMVKESSNGDCRRGGT